MTASLLARKGDAQPSTMPEHAPLRGFVRISSPPSPPAVHRQFEKLDSVFSVPPTDMRAAERGTPIRSDDAPPVVHDLRHEPVVAEAIAPPPPDVAEPKAPVVKPAPVAKSVEPAQIDKPRRMFVNLSPEEYERLGIIAVKKDSSRHQLLRDALDAFLKKMSREYKADCACVASGGCKGTCED